MLSQVPPAKPFRMVLGALYIQQGGTCQGSCPFGVLFLAPNLIVLQVALHGPRGLDDFFIGLIRWRAVRLQPRGPEFLIVRLLEVSAAGDG
jgi:hypothetical protein